ncbi:MAG: hypothetical protein JW829_15590 [Pirellulales bacterium]|nr:hypothetical protein [Pirellulales bacterium]
MTTVRPSYGFGLAEVRVNGRLQWAVLINLVFTAIAVAQDGSVHWRHVGAMPPGAIGSQRLMGGGPLSAYIQPVKIIAPEGAMISMVEGNAFGPALPAPLLAGMQIARVYRLRITNIPGYPGLEVFPTIEVIDRLHPPPGEELRFPIPIECTRDELLLAARGSYVTRVIYVEDPNQAVPIQEEPDRQSWFEAPSGQDPLVVADQLGRSVAILRMGSRLPEPNADGDAFHYGSPPVVVHGQNE